MAKGRQIISDVHFAGLRAFNRRGDGSFDVEVHHVYRFDGDRIANMYLQKHDRR